MSGLWTQFKQRKLVQWALAYVAFAFALLQGVDIVAQRFDWPDSMERILIIALCIGFFVVLLVAWYHGEQGRQRVSGTELLLIALVLAVGGGFLWQFARMPHVATPLHALPARAASSRGATVAESGTAIPPKSIAVLPFLDLSPDKNQTYFAEGVAEQLLDILAQSTRLKVAGRTSAFQFRDRSESTKKIGSLLGVRYLLEGSLRKDGKRVRITVQLVDTRSGYQKWSKTYQRKLTDIFKVQDEISRAIADALEVKLGIAGGDMAVARSDPSTSPAAYDQYLMGRYLLNKRTDASVRQALVHFKRAVALDPDYAPANAQIAIVYTLLTKANYGDDTYQGAIARARPYLERAISAAPDSAETQAAQGRIGVIADAPARTVLAHLDKAVQANPSYMDAVVWKAQTLQFAGRFREALSTLRAGASRDPLNYIVNVNYVGALTSRHRYDEARAVARRFMQLDAAKANLMLGSIADFQGRPAHALRYCLTAMQKGGTSTPFGEMVIGVLDEAGLFGDARNLRRWNDGGIGAALAGDLASVHRIRSFLHSHDGPKPHAAAATIDLILGHHDDALRQFDRMLRADRKYHSHFAWLFGQVEYAALLREAGRTEESRQWLDRARRRTGMLRSRARMAGVSWPEGLWLWAGIEIMDGRRDQGLAELARAVRTPGYLNSGFVWPLGPLYLQRAPQFDAVRGDPRFKAIVQQARQHQHAVRKAILPVLCGRKYPLSGWSPMPSTCPRVAPAATASRH